MVALSCCVQKNVGDKSFKVFVHLYTRLTLEYFNVFFVDFGTLNTKLKFYLSQINTFGDMMHSFPSFPL